MRIPWLVVGLVVGCLFMQTWSQQTEFQAVMELAIKGGAGLLVGLAIDVAIQLRRKSN